MQLHPARSTQQTRPADEGFSEMNRELPRAALPLVLPDASYPLPSRAAAPGRIREEPSGTAYFLRRATLFITIVSALWVIFFAIDRSFPYVKNGAILIYQQKINAFVTQGKYFSSTDRNRVLVFGNSQILSGFRPDLFEVEAPSQTKALNMGLPDTSRFAESYLRTMVDRGQAPTHVVLTLPWTTDAAHFSPFNVAGQDLEVIETFFPFRPFLSNFLNFLSRARRAGGIVAYYHQGYEDVAAMVRDRGYYFITSEAVSPDYRLPETFRLPVDTPRSPMPPRNFDFGSTAYAELRELADRYHFTVIIAPAYVRPPQFAPEPIGMAGTKINRRADGTIVVQASYLTIDNREFVDAEHLNPEGATTYTNYLVRLFNDNELWR
jgi:hypothetical protein